MQDINRCDLREQGDGNVTIVKHWRVAASFKMYIGVQPPLRFSPLHAVLSLILSVHFLMFAGM